MADPKTKSDPSDLLQSLPPELMAAVIAAVRPAIEAEFAARAAALPSPEARFFDQMAASIDALANQGRRTLKVPPEILARRNASRQKMWDLITARRQAIADSPPNSNAQEWPLYRVIDVLFLADQLIQPYAPVGRSAELQPTYIYFDGAPCIQMAPANEHAKAIHAAFVGSCATTQEMANPQHESYDPTGGPKPIWFSNSRVIVRGSSAPRDRGIINAGFTDGRSANAEEYRDRFAIAGAPDPNARSVRILGSIHPPAEANYHGPDASMMIPAIRGAA